MDDLKKLKESSKEAVENLDSFSSFKKYMHIKRQVETELVELINMAHNSSKSQLILVCGGVGDGKSHLLSFLKNTYPDILGKFYLHNDATESFDPKKTSLDTLNLVLDPFSDEKLKTETGKKIILAINLGALNNFIDSQYQERYKALKKFVEEKHILESEIVDNSFDNVSNFQFINFSDYHMYSLTERGPKSDYIKSLFLKVTQPDKQNPFYQSFMSNCKECTVANSCPIKSNFEFIQNGKIQDRMVDLLVEGMVKHKLIISTRALLNFIYDILVSNQIDQQSVDKIPVFLEKLKPHEYIYHLTPNLLFIHRDISKIFEVLSRLDPIHYRSEEMDRLYITLNTRENLASLFDEYIDLNQYSFLNEILNRDVYLNELMQKVKYFKDDLIKLFIRLYLFFPKREGIVLRDPTYLKYMEYLYYWNVGKKPKLRHVYSDIKEAIYHWNGEAGKEKVNLFIGKSQLKYKIIQGLDLVPFVGNLKEKNNDELDKFLPFIVLNFKKNGDDSNKTLCQIEIDYALYKLLMKVRNGYRPNKKDKNNFINFVEFMDKVLNLGDQNRELIFEEKLGENLLKYRLSYDKEFEEYNFVGISK